MNMNPQIRNIEMDTSEIREIRQSINVIHLYITTLFLY